MQFKTWQELEKEFINDINHEWMGIYKDRPFIEMIVKRVFYYYDKSGKALPSRDDWKRAITSFLTKNHNQPTINNNSIKKPLGSVPFVRSAPKPAGVDQVFPDLKEICDYCHDLQVIQVHSLDGTHSSLMLCDCAPSNDESLWKLPKWEAKLASIYRKSPCPLAWFKPEIMDDKVVGERFDEKVRMWRKRIRDAESLWSKMKLDQVP